MTDQAGSDIPDELEQAAEPFEPEAPAHLDPDAETVVHDEDLDEEAVVDEEEPALDEPAT
ncbi:hypothetical protein [Nocardioides sp. zg-1230]|jgi:hypothetical protein|uniref:hypothetical protein n=1 Tax=Nocardioides sp. zg-1230 TaxID=2736601 RepID=UPI0015522335|nr:hypothetical protein [Nocardioides sp. zg-1230]NPC41928.1 hypothetical protein [Nocardioides sp. zg-1230]